MSLTESLRGIDIFSSLSEQELNRVEAVIREETFPEGGIIFRENSEGDRIYIIKQGSIDIGKRGLESRGVIRLLRLEAGEVLGELSIFDDKPRSASAVAAGRGNTILLSIGKSELHRIMTQDQTLAIKILSGILRKIASRLRLADDVMSGLADLMTR